MATTSGDEDVSHPIQGNMQTSKMTEGKRKVSVSIGLTTLDGLQLTYHNS